ncbi:hypothetical protein Tco_1409779 [Tanacetum coccineum]
MQIMLEANGLWKMIEPLETTQSDNKKDKTAIAFLYQALPEEQLLQITKHKTAKAIWDALKTRHIGEERVQQARLQTLKSEFEMLHMKEDETIDTFTRKLTTLIVASIEQYSDLDEMSVDEAIGRLKTFEERIKSKKKIPVDSQESLMFTRPEGQRNILENVEDLTSLKAKNKTRTIIKGKNERLLKIQETNLKSHVTDVTNLDTMPMNVQINARIKSEESPILLKKT